jgi:hypothetical protein
VPFTITLQSFSFFDRRNVEKSQFYSCAITKVLPFLGLHFTWPYNVPWPRLEKLIILVLMLLCPSFIYCLRIYYTLNRRKPLNGLRWASVVSDGKVGSHCLLLHSYSATEDIET